MSDRAIHTGREIIPEEIMLARLGQSEQMRDFFIQMWLQNPALATQGGRAVELILQPAIAVREV